MGSPVEEQARVAAVHSYGLLDAPSPVVLDDLTRLATAVFDTPISTVTLVDRDRQWFAGSTGMADRQGCRSTSFCAQMVDDPRMLVVPDASIHPLFRNWANVLGAPHIRYYAGAPLVDEDGFVLGSVCVIDDHVHDAADRRLDLLTNLAGQAAGHVTAIRDRIRRSVLDDELTRAHEREEDIVAAISHELRTPVSTIQGYLEMLADEPALEPYRQMLEPIHRNGDRLVQMVDHLLAGTRPAGLPVTRKRARVNLTEVAHAAVAACAAPARHRSTRIAVEADGNPAEVAGDFARLSQAAEQLIRNAVLFSPAKAEVTVRVKAGARPTVEVVDHGAGIPGHEIAYVNQRFYRGHHAREQAIPGLGLGLHIAERIAAGHHGALSVTSAGPGHGTTARLSLPAA